MNETFVSTQHLRYRFRARTGIAVLADLGFYTDGAALGVEIKTGPSSEQRCFRNRYRKWWLLKNVMFTLATESPTPAPTVPACPLPPGYIL